MFLQIIALELIFILMFISGFIVLRSFTKEDRFLILLPAGFFVGLSFYITLLYIFSRFASGGVCILLASLLLLIVSFYLIKFTRKKWSRLERINFKTKFVYSLIVLFAVVPAHIKMLSLYPAADSTMQWAYAGAFSRGNFPLKVPWQPNLDPKYHLGVYLFEGAVNRITGLEFITIHSLLNSMILTNLVLLILGIFWNAIYGIKNIFLLFLPFVFCLSFGVILIFLPEIRILTNFSALEIIAKPPLTSQIPPKFDVSGGGLIDIDTLSYLPARGMAFAIILTLVFLLTTSWHKIWQRDFLIILLLSALAFIEESVFLPAIATASIIVMLFALYSYFRPKFRSLTFSLLRILSFTTLLTSVFGAFLYDHIFNIGVHSYRISIPLLTQIDTLKLVKFNSLISSFPNSSLVHWGVINPLLLLGFVAFTAIIKDRLILWVFILFSLMSFMLYLSIDHLYNPNVSIRFYTTGFWTTGLGFLYSLFFIIKDYQLKRYLISLLLIISIIIVPTIWPEVIRQSTNINTGLTQNIPQAILNYKSQAPINQIALWSRQNLPTSSRILVMDREFPTPSGSLHFQYQGIYTIYGPNDIYIFHHEPGSEYFDLALTLNPTLLKTSRVEYLYLESDSDIFRYLPQARKKDLTDPNYFQVLKTYDFINVDNKSSFYRLYKILPTYYETNNGGSEITEGSFATLQKLIPTNSSVLISDFPGINFWYRMALSLSLHDRQLALKPRDHENKSLQPQSGYMMIEINFNTIEDRKDGLYDFYVLSVNDKPEPKALKIWSNHYASAWKREKVN